MLIASSDNNKIKLLRSLVNQKKARKEHRLFIVEGATLYRETPSFYIQDTFVRAGNQDLLQLAHSKCKNVYEVEPRVFDSISDVVSPSGIIATVSMYVEKCSLGNRILLLDGVKDPGNVGTLIRTAAGFKLDSVVLIDTADPYSPKVVRSAMGALFKLGVLEMSRLDAITALRGRNIFALDMDGVDLKTVTFEYDYIIAVGNEAHGISDEVKGIATKVVAIKAEGIESLNAAIAGSIAMFHFSK